jgi:hypothetical protein
MKLVNSQVEFSTQFCGRHPKYLKDCIYHNYKPSLPVLLNLQVMLKSLQDACTSTKNTKVNNNYFGKHLMHCQKLVMQAIQEYHGDTANRLTEALTHHKNINHKIP